MSVANRDKRAIVFPAKRLADLGFRLLATGGTAGVLQRAGIPVERVAKVSEGPDNVGGDDPRRARRPGRSTRRSGGAPRTDGYFIRTAAASAGVPCITTLPGVFAAVRGIEALRGAPTEPRSIQEYHAEAMAEPVQARLTFEQAAAATGAGDMPSVKRVRAEILSTRRLGAYHSLTLVAPEIAERARPGQFLAMRCRRAGSSCCGGTSRSIRRRGAAGGPARSSSWSTSRARAPRGSRGTAHEFLDVIGPLGQAVRVSEAADELPAGRGGARRGLAVLPRAGAARAAQARRHDRRRETLERVFKPIEGKRLSQTISIVTADGTLGDRGDVAGRAAGDGRAMRHRGALRGGARRHARQGSPASAGNAASRAGRGRGAMGCGVGLCFTCVVPVARKDGSGYDHLRRAWTDRCSTRRASCGTGGSPTRRRCSRRRPRACRWCARGRGEAELAVDLRRASSLPTPVMVARDAPAPGGSSAGSSTCARSAGS